MLRLVLGLAVVGALGYFLVKGMGTRNAQPIAVPADVPELRPVRPAQAAEQITNQMQQIENQNRAAMDRVLQGAR
jgi:hypothetical protein